MLGCTVLLCKCLELQPGPLQTTAIGHEADIMLCSARWVFAAQCFCTADARM